MSDSMYDVFSWMDWWMSEFHVTSMEEVQEERNPTQHSGISFMLQWHSKIRLGRPPQGQLNSNLAFWPSVKEAVGRSICPPLVNDATAALCKWNFSSNNSKCVGFFSRGAEPHPHNQCTCLWAVLEVSNSVYHVHRPFP